MLVLWTILLFLALANLRTRSETRFHTQPVLGSMSFQIDAIGDRGSANDKDLDSAQFGASLQIGENGTIGFGYIKHPDAKDMVRTATRGKRGYL